MDVESLVYLMSVKANFLISFNWIVNSHYYFQEQFRNTMLRDGLQYLLLIELKQMVNF